MDKHEFLSQYGVDDLMHYGVKGMRKGVTKAQDPTDPLGNGDTSNLNGVNAKTLLSGTERTSSSDSGGVTSTYRYNVGKLDQFVNKMFDRKVDVMRGKNVSSRVKQGKVNKFMDKLFKQLVRKK